LYPDPGQAYSDSGVDAFIDRLYRTTEMRLKVIDHLRRREDWDFFMVVFSGTDTVSHAMWKYMDTTHPLHDRTKHLKYGGAIQAFYQYVDRALGALIDSLGEDTVVMLMSDHGFGPFYKFIHVNNWLQQQGWMQIKRNPVALLKAALFRLGFAPMSIYNLLMLFGLGRLKREVVRGGRGQDLLKRLFLSFEDVDWSRTEAYSLGNVGQIFLNVRGREPAGIVEPGPDYERLRDEIMARLGEIRDPETGEKVVQGIYRREEIYSGPALDHAPDIVFIPTRMEYFGFGEYEFGSNRVIEQMKRGISGTHRLQGIFLLHGEPVRAGAWVEGAQIIDLAPTILHLMGEPVPAGMDGRVLTQALQEAFEPAPAAAGANGAGEPGEPGEFSADELTAEDEEVIIQRLRGLGYVG
ncbi:MAG TPA: alkaline phosphatase family protein, partial [Anaerolineaceae bacterium]|nr:alkaline phosphatase family protein [Anaerolineaceae bacterium]